VKTRYEWELHELRKIGGILATVYTHTYIYIYDDDDGGEGV
jgi:hypothetical protein